MGMVPIFMLPGWVIFGRGLPLAALFVVASVFNVYLSRSSSRILLFLSIIPCVVSALLVVTFIGYRMNCEGAVTCTW